MMARKAEPYVPSPEVTALLPDVSGNAINGLGERDFRKASPMFWHPPSEHPFGALAAHAGASCRVTAEAREAFAGAYDYPELVPIAETRASAHASDLTARARAFALETGADLFGATGMCDAYVFEGYAVEAANIIVLGFAHDYDSLREAPSSATNSVAVTEIGRQYARGTRVSYALANWIRSQG